MSLSRKLTFLDGQTPEHLECNNHLHPLPLLPPSDEKERRHHCPIQKFESKEFSRRSKDSPPKFSPIYRGDGSPSVHRSKFQLPRQWEIPSNLRIREITGSKTITCRDESDLNHHLLIRNTHLERRASSIGEVTWPTLQLRRAFKALPACRGTPHKDKN